MRLFWSKRVYYSSEYDLDLDVERHLYLFGIRKSSKEGKKIIEEYPNNEKMEIEEEYIDEDFSKKELDGQQSSLDQFF